MPSFTKRDGPPVFSAGELARLMGLTTSTVVTRWIEPGLLEATQEAAGHGLRYTITPAALLAFIRAHPDAYAPGRITDEQLRQEAEHVDRADPPVSLAELAAQASLPLKQVQHFAAQGVFPTVRRPGVTQRGWSPAMLRRSQVPAALKALKEATAVPTALDALHALLAKPAPSVVTEAKPVVKTLGPGYIPNGSTDWRGQPLPAKAPQERCGRCDGKLLAGQDPETRQPVLVCMSCGEERRPAGPDPVAERQQQDLERARAETDARRGPGRPSKIAHGGR
jgi:hypothetical protein